MSRNDLKVLLIVFGIGVGSGMAGTGAIYELKKIPKPPIIQLNPDLRNQVQNLNTQVAVLQGQVQSINERYNNHGSKLEVIEDRMKIFNRKVE